MTWAVFLVTALQGGAQSGCSSTAVTRTSICICRKALFHPSVLLNEALSSLDADAARSNETGVCFKLCTQPLCAAESARPFCKRAVVPQWQDADTQMKVVRTDFNDTAATCG